MSIRLRNESDSDDLDGDGGSKDEPLFHSTSKNDVDDELDSEDEQVRRKAMEEHLAEFGSVKTISKENSTQPKASPEARSAKRKLNELDSDDDDDLRMKSQLTSSKKDTTIKRRPVQVDRQVSSDDDDVKNTKGKVASSDVIFRSRTGGKISRDEFLKERSLGGHKNKPERVKREKLSEKQLPWGGGLAQKREEAARAEAERLIAREPVARFEIPESLDRKLKDAERWDDPLNAMKRLEGGSHVTSAKSMTSKFPAPPNRFNIKPGHRWDGRIRGNGFEERYLAALSGSLSKPTMAMYSAMD